MINKNISIGKVYKVHYLIFLKNKKRKKKSCFFIGLCFNKKNNFFQIINKIRKEKIFLNFDINSPVIFKLIQIKIYKKINCRISKLFFKNNKTYFDDTNTKGNIIDSNIYSINMRYYFSSYFRITAIRRRRKLRKIKRKYFRTLKWLKCKWFVRNEYFF